MGVLAADSFLAVAEMGRVWDSEKWVRWSFDENRNE
jgi:hypothetical protein